MKTKKWFRKTTAICAAALLGTAAIPSTAFAADSYASIEKDAWAKKVTEMVSSYAAAYKSLWTTICLCFHRAYPPFHLLISICWFFSKKVSPGRKNFNFFLAVSTMLKIL